jgi:hypothetical protein
VPRLPSADVVVPRVRLDAAGVPARGRDHAREDIERLLHAPEAPAREDRDAVAAPRRRERQRRGRVFWAVEVSEIVCDVLPQRERQREEAEVENVSPRRVRLVRGGRGRGGRRRLDVAGRGRAFCDAPAASGRDSRRRRMRAVLYERKSGWS